MRLRGIDPLRQAAEGAAEGTVIQSEPNRLENVTVVVLEFLL